MPKDKSTNQSRDLPWPCPHCRYDLRATIDSWTNPIVICPECGKRCSWKDVHDGLVSAAPAGFLWWILAFTPAIALAGVILYELLNLNRGSQTSWITIAVFSFFLLAPYVSALFRYRHYPIWTGRILLAMFMYLSLLFFNCMALLAVGLLFVLVQWWLNL